MDERSLGRMVGWARRRAGMTQRDLARAVRMPQPSIARLERGTVAPRAATLLAILGATGHHLVVEPGVDLSEDDREQIRRRLVLNPPQRTWEALGNLGGDRRQSPTWFLRRLRRFGVRFVLVGELAEAVHGSPMRVGRLVEVCLDPSAESHERLSAALDDLGVPAAPRDGGAGHEANSHAGTLRLLTVTAGGDDYATLARNATDVLVDVSLLVRVASLDDLMRIRRARGGEDDRLAEARLWAVAEQLARPPSYLDDSAAGR